MLTTKVCNNARLMSRTADRALRFAYVLLLVATASVVLPGCDQIDGRSGNKKGNHHFREKNFVGAVGAYEKALKTVDDPIIHYNLGLSYSKIFKPGVEDNPATPDNEGLVILDVAGSLACQQIPGVKSLSKSVCVKPGDHRFDACDAKNVCASSFQCKQSDLCTADNAALADMAANHFGVWVKAHPTDAETRALMTQVWIDSSQYKKAIDYWEALLVAKPNDPEIMGSLAGINLKAGDWRKSIEWFQKVAGVAKDETAKVAALQFIGNVAWSKLNSKSLNTDETVELADYGIGALQAAAVIQPKNPRLTGLMGSIFNFRSLAQGASWAAALDRAKAQDLQIASRVLSDEAKKAQGLPVTPTPAPGAPAAPAPAGKETPAPATGGVTQKTGG
jgi:tetratricopeptide (TPR) repeat protein